MINFFKKYWLLILVSLAAVLFVVNKILETKQSPSKIPEPVNTNVANYRSITPGTSKLDDVNNLLGFPLGEIKIDGKLISEYQSSNQYRNHVVIFENNTVNLIKEKIISPEDKSANSITKEFGASPYILYSRDPSAVFDLYVYPNNGIAYLGASDGTVLEVWYFKPTTIEEFIDKWGEGYSKEKPTQKNPY